MSIKEIKEIIDAPNHILKAALEERIKKLKEDSEHKENMIRKAHEMMEQL